MFPKYIFVFIWQNAARGDLTYKMYRCVLLAAAALLCFPLAAAVQRDLGADADWLGAETAEHDPDLLRVSGQ